MTGSKAASRNSTTRFWNGSVSMRFTASLLPEKWSVPHLEYMLVKCQVRWKEQQPPSNSSFFLGRNFFGLDYAGSAKICGELAGATGRRSSTSQTSEVFHAIAQSPSIKHITETHIRQWLLLSPSVSESLLLLSSYVMPEFYLRQSMTDIWFNRVAPAW